MDIGSIITQLKGHASVFAGNVAGAADFETGLASTVNLPYPAAFVLPLGESTDLTNDDMTGYYQVVDERFGVVVEVSNGNDRRGQAAASGLDALRTSIFSALLNWRYDIESQPKGLIYAGADLVVFDRARLFYQFSFVNRYVLTDLDGYQPVGVPLAQVQIHDLNTPTTADVIIPQV